MSLSAKLPLMFFLGKVILMEFTTPYDIMSIFSGFTLYTFEICSFVRFFSTYCMFSFVLKIRSFSKKYSILYCELNEFFETIEAEVKEEKPEQAKETNFKPLADKITLFEIKQKLKTRNMNTFKYKHQ